MKWLAVFLFSVCFFPNASLAQSGSEQELKITLEQLRQAQVRKDVNAIERLYANGFVALNTDGTLADKATRLKQLSDSPVKFKTLDFSDLNIRVYGTTAVVTGISHATAENRAPHSLRFMQVWVKRDSGWQEAALAMTDIKNATSEHDVK